MIFFENTPEKNAMYKVFQETINTEKKRKIGKEDDISVPNELFHLDPNSIIEKDIRMMLTLFLAPSGIPVKNRKVKLKTYKNCFLGKDMVNWLCEKNIAEDRHSATLIGQKFIDLKYMKHAGEENGIFKDDTNSPYRFDSISMDREKPRPSRTRSQGIDHKLIKSAIHITRVHAEGSEGSFQTETPEQSNMQVTDNE